MSSSGLHSLTYVSLLSFAGLAYFFLVLLVRLVTRPSSPGLLLEERPTEMPLFWRGPPVLLMSLLCHTTMLQAVKAYSGTAKSEVLRAAEPILLQLFPAFRRCSTEIHEISN